MRRVGDRGVVGERSRGEREEVRWKMAVSVGTELVLSPWECLFFLEFLEKGVVGGREGTKRGGRGDLGVERDWRKA